MHLCPAAWPTFGFFRSRRPGILRRQPYWISPVVGALLLTFSSLYAGDAELEMGRRLAVQTAIKTTVAIECQAGRQGYFGTGVLISRDGHILTSITVVPDKAMNIRVWLKGEEKTYTAKALEVANSTEGSLIQITSTRHDFPYAEMLDTTKIPLGTHIFTMGNPLQALKNDDQVAVSSGIISGMYKLKNGDKESKYNGLVIETDAAVNPGSDGGPIFDEKGRLAAIITLGFEPERLQGCGIPTHILSASLKNLQDIVKTYDGRRLRAPIAPTDPLEAALGAAAVKIAPKVVRINVVREPDRLPPIPGNLHPNQAAQVQAQLKQLELTLRPLAPITGLLISPDEVLTSAALVIDNKLVVANTKIAGDLKSLSLIDAAGQSHTVKLVGYHELMDLALLKIEGYSAPAFATLDTKAVVTTGAGVAVVGRIQGSDSFTFTKGMVSAVGRSLGLNQAKAYQTDALINYGNAGGPVVDIYGNVVGLAGHVRIGSSWGQSAGVGFFVGSKDILAVLPDLRAGKRIIFPSRTYLGVEPEPKPEGEGSVIKKVLPDSPASKGGLKDGDRVIAADGEPIMEWSELLRLVTQKRPGDRLILLVKRGEEEEEITILLESHQDPGGEVASPNQPGKAPTDPNGDGLEPAPAEKPSTPGKLNGF